MFSENLKNLRLSQNITQDYIAEKLHVTKATVSNWEKGKTEPSSIQIKKICEILNTTPNEIYDVDEKENKNLPFFGKSITNEEYNYLMKQLEIFRNIKDYKGE